MNERSVAVTVVIVAALLIELALVWRYTHPKPKRFRPRAGGPVCPVCRKSAGYAPIADKRRCMAHR